MDTCTVAAPDVIAAFAVPNPNFPSQGSRFFRVWWLRELPRKADHPTYFGPVNVPWTNPFSRRQTHATPPESGNASDGDHKPSADLCITQDFCGKAVIERGL